MDIEAFFDFLDKNAISLQNIKEMNILSFIAQYSVNNKSRARALSSIKTFFRFLNLKDFPILETQIENIKSPKIPKTLPEYLDIEEIEIFFSQFKPINQETIRDKAMAESLYSCGLRISEMIQIEMHHLNLEENFIIVTGKGNKERFVPINRILKENLTQYLKNSRPFFNHKNSNYLFLTRFHKPFSRVGAWKIIKKYAQISGLPKNIKPHMFRHSFATHLLSNGADLRIIQELLGHSHVSTTQIYTHVQSKELKEMIDKYHPLSNIEL